MKITNKNNESIQDIDSWGIALGKPIHWKEGRSAHSLAKFFTSPTIEESIGCKKIKEYLSKCGIDNIKFDKAIIEYNSKFDTYRGKTREHDMVIWGETNNQDVIICIEAKVDEKFNGNYVNQAYLKKLGTTSNIPNRIEGLRDKFFPGQDISTLTGIRYQLLYYLAGSVSEAGNGEIVFMPILVFHTDAYNTKNGEKNKKDFDKFIISLGFSLCDADKQVYKGHFEGVDVYISYIDISEDELNGIL